MEESRVGELQESAFAHSPALELQAQAIVPGFLYGTGNPNSGPPSCAGFNGGLDSLPLSTSSS